MKVKEESEKVGFKLNIQKTKITASGPITSWQIYGETVETVADFIFLSSKITADGDCSMKLKDACSLEKSYEQPRQHIKKERHYFANKGPSSQFSSVQFSSVARSCPTLCDPMNRSRLGLPVHHRLPESTQTHVHCVGDAIQPSHPPSSPSPPALNLSQHQGLFK